MSVPSGLALGIAKALTLLFWWLVVLNLLSPFPKPFSALVSLAGAGLLALHVVELLVCNRRLRARSRPWLDRALVLLTGIFHLQSIPPATSPAEA